MALLESRIYIFDDMFPDLPAVVEEARKCDFLKIDSPYQGRDSNFETPKWVRDILVAKIEQVSPFYFSFKKSGFRLALEGDLPGNPFPHTDSEIHNHRSEYSLITYLSDPLPGESLEFYEHTVLGKFSLGDYVSMYAQKKSVFDDPAQWKSYAKVPIVKNRAVFFPSMFFHRPNPCAGRGKDFDTGRLILPTFIEVGWKANWHASPEPVILQVNKV